MKTLNLTLRTLLLTFVLGSTATTALAYDFVVKGIYYNINGDEATVTYKYKESHNSGYGIYYTYSSDYSGDVTIPEIVTYNGISYSVTSIDDHAFIDCSGLINIILPNTIIRIGASAFSGCYGLTNICIPSSVSTIESSAFFSCVGLRNITIPNSVTSIGSSAFYHCVNMKSIIIGNSVSSIGDQAFYDCTNISSVICLGETPPAAYTSCFNNYSKTKLYVPIASIEIYRTTSVWSSFTNVYGFGNDSFSIPDNTAFHGDTIVIPVSMQNENEITAFQTDVYLPEGFELVQENGEYQVSLSDRKGRDHVVMVNDAPDGALRVLSYSPTLKPFKNNEGELFYITVKVPEGASGNYPIWLRNTILTSTDEEELYAIDALSNVKVYNYKMGDVNNSGDITVADVVTTARYILNYNPEPFVFEAADMNGDGKITITDVVKIANLILDQDYESTMRGALLNEDRMSGEFNGSTVSINLDNAMEYTAFQLDLTLPEGMNASDFVLTDRASNLGLVEKDRGNGKVRLLCYAPDLKTIKGNDGSVINFNVEGLMGDITVDRIELVNLDGQPVNLDAFTIAVSNPTALNELTTGKTIARVDYFNLAGQQITDPITGVTLVVTTYTDGTRTTGKVIR